MVSSIIYNNYISNFKNINSQNRCVIWYAHNSLNENSKKTTTELDGYLKPELDALLPEWEGGVRGALRVHLLLEVQLAASFVNIDGVEVDTELETAGCGEDVDLVAEEEHENNWAGQVSDEEGLGIKIWSSDWL